MGRGEGLDTASGDGREERRGETARLRVGEGRGGQSWLGRLRGMEEGGDVEEGVLCMEVDGVWVAGREECVESVSRSKRGHRRSGKGVC